MGKLGALRRLLRSCLPCSVHKHDKSEVEKNQVSNPNDDHGEGVLVSLPEDIILDVLARLPVKTLCQLRCVCKTWRALISDPAFIAAHGRSRAAAGAPLVMGVFRVPRPPDKKPHPLLVPFKKKPCYLLQPEPSSLELRVMDTADGSVLRVVNGVSSRCLMRSDTDLVLINRGKHGACVIDPSSGRAAIVGGEPAPQKYPTTDYSGTRRVSVYNSFCSSTLGRAGPSGAYKILRLRDAWLGYHSATQICQIATLGLEGINGTVTIETTWRQRPEPPIITRQVSMDSITTTSAGGTLHFLHAGAPAHGRCAAGPPGWKRIASFGLWNRIASFDLESEEWTATIDGPSIGDPNEGESWDITIAVRGSLCLVQTVVGPCSRYTSLWILVDKDKSTWVKQHTVQMPECLRYFNVLDILVDGRILMLNSFKIEGKCKCRSILRLYCPRSGTHTNLMEMAEDLEGPLRLCTQSLLS